MNGHLQNCFHLTVEIIKEIHAEAIQQFGGSDGVREIALLESALGAPQATFGGNSPYGRSDGDCSRVFILFVPKSSLR